MYSGPNFKDSNRYALKTLSGTSSLVSAANACEAATFISSLIALARTSSAPRKDVWETKHIIDLVGVIRAPGCHNCIGTGFPCQFIFDFGVRICHGKYKRLHSHGFNHFRSEGCLLSKARKKRLHPSLPLPGCACRFHSPNVPCIYSSPPRDLCRPLRGYPPA